MTLAPIMIVKSKTKVGQIQEQNISLAIILSHDSTVYYILTSILV